MRRDQFMEDIELDAFSTTLSPITKTINQREVPIQPWNIDGKHYYNTKFSLKNDRLQTFQNRNIEKKRSIDQRIVQMYRKYSNDGILIENGNQGILNSRQLYREKLKEFQNGTQFKRMGSKREKQSLGLSISQNKQSQQLSFRRANLYYCDYIEFRTNPQGYKKIKSDYRCNDKFQRMLKLKDKLRKKNNLSVSKQKQKYQNQYQPSSLHAHRQINYAVMAKATIERNKLKIKMRGLSKQELQKKKEYSNQLNYHIEVVGYQTSNGQPKVQKQGLVINYERWKRLEKDPILEKMSQTLSHFNY